MNILIPMAGLGSRFANAGYDVPKPMVEFEGKMMIEWAVDTLNVDGRLIFVIREEHEVEHGLGSSLQSRYPGCVVVLLGDVTEGAACTALLARDHLNSPEELIITNCDQVLEWNSPAFLRYVRGLHQLDGAVVTYDSAKTINSYVWLDEETGWATAVREKTGVSPYSLNGIHYWKRGSDFVWSASALVDSKKTVKGEYYISETYNPLIDDGSKISAYHIPNTQHHAVGTPEDLQIYLEKL